MSALDASLARGNSSLGGPMPNSSYLLTPRMISDFCSKRIAIFLPPKETERFRIYLTWLLDSSVSPPLVRGAPDWQGVAADADIGPDVLRSLSASIRPVLDAIARSIDQS